MKKSIIISAIIVLFILGTVIGVILIKNISSEKTETEIAELGTVIGVILIKNISSEKTETEIAEQNQEEIYDECTDEYEEMVESNTLVEETSSEGEKISPNCSIIFRRHYNDCGHTIEQYSSIPTELVNKTEEDLQEQYEGWTVETFSRNQIILYREFDSECGEHYVLREKEGKVVVYLKTGDTEELVEETDIATEFLTETDRIELQNGIEANGRVELNQLIEDYE